MVQLQASTIGATNSCADIPTTREIGDFLAGYAALLLGSGATCIRLEKNVQRMAAKWNARISMTIMPRHIHLFVAGPEGDCQTFISTIDKTLISYDIITRLSKLSWKVADRNLSLAEAREIFESVRETPCANKWWVLLAASCANASFCRLFGGDIRAMVIVFAATMAGYYLKQIMLGARCDVRLTFIACSFVSAVLAAAGYLFSLGDTPDIALATSALYLVPGIPFLNSFSDLIAGHYICFFSRLTDAVILTCCLSTGLCLGMKLMNIGMF